MGRLVQRRDARRRAAPPDGSVRRNPPEGAPEGAPRERPSGGEPGRCRGAIGAFGQVTGSMGSGFTVESQAPGIGTTTLHRPQCTPPRTPRPGRRTEKATARRSRWGRCVTSLGKTGSTGAVAAASITVSAPVDGACTACSAAPGARVDPARTRKARTRGARTGRARTREAGGRCRSRCCRAIVVGTGGYAVAQTRGAELSYRTATAAAADVERTLELSGTVTAAGRRDLSFGAAGSVSKVAVRAGQRVSRGQVLARARPHPWTRP